MKGRSGSGIYPGWWIVSTAMVIMALTFASMINLGGLFVVPVTDELGVSRTAFTLHMSLSSLSATAALLFTGPVFAKFPLKAVMSVCSLVVTAGLFGYSVAGRIWHFYLISIVVGFFAMGMCNVPISILINNWFGPKLRGKAMGLAMAGSGIGATILNPVLSGCMEVLGWRMGYRILALLNLALVLPMILRTIVKTPEEKGLRQLGQEARPREKPAEGTAASGTARSPLFWATLLAMALFSVTTSVYTSNGVSYYQDIGLDPVKAGSMISVFSGALIFSKVLLGTICDRIGTLRGTVFSITVDIVALALLILSSKYVGLSVLSAMLFGLGSAFATVSLPLIVGDLFGNGNYGTIVGYCNIGANLGASIAPVLASSIYDASGSYLPAWWVTMVLMAVTIGLLVWMYRDKRETI